MEFQVGCFSPKWTSKILDVEVDEPHGYDRFKQDGRVLLYKTVFCDVKKKLLLAF